MAALIFALAAIVAGWKFVEADSERVRAEHSEISARTARIAAEKATSLAIATANGLVLEIAEVFLNRGLPVDVARTVLDRALALQGALPTINADALDLAESHAAALSAAGHLLVVTGDPERAEPLLQEAREGFQRLLRVDPSSLEWSAGLAQVLERIANLHYWQGDLDAAASLVQEALSLRRYPQTDNPSVQSAELTAQAELLLLAQDYAGARPLLETAIRVIDTANTGLAPDHAMRLFAARPYRHLGAVLMAQGDVTGAYDALFTAYILAERHVGSEPASLYAKAFAWEVATDLATVADEIRDPETLFYLSKAERHAENSVALDPKSEQVRRMLLVSRLKKLQFALRKNGPQVIDQRLGELDRLNDESDAGRRNALDWIRLRAEYNVTMGEVALAEGAASAAADRFRTALATLNAAHERMARFHEYHELRSRVLFGLAQTQSDGAKARELRAESLFHLERSAHSTASDRLFQQHPTICSTGIRPVGGGGLKQGFYC